jgi:UDP-glucose 4-epimerase
VKVGVTGGAGFIGSNLVESLLLDGHKVTVFDDLSSGLRSNIEFLDCEFIEGSLVNQEALNLFVQEVDFVFHLAARGSVPRSMSSPRETFDANILGTQNLLDAVKAKRLPIVFSSSSSVYGNNPQLPKEESLLLDPISPYAASKAAGEHLVSAYAKSFQLECQIFRFFNVYGPRQRPDHIYSAVIPRWIWSALRGEEIRIFGDGNQVRDFTFVQDVVTVLKRTLTTLERSSGPINLALGNPTSLNTLVDLIRFWFPTLRVSYHPPRGGDVEKSYGDPRLLQEFSPDLLATGLETGLEKTILWLTEEFQNSDKKVAG